MTKKQNYALQRHGDILLNTLESITCGFVVLVALLLFVYFISLCLFVLSVLGRINLSLPRFFCVVVLLFNFLVSIILCSC